jgi:hypothetical protein
MKLLKKQGKKRFTKELKALKVPGIDMPNRVTSEAIRKLIIYLLLYYDWTANITLEEKTILENLLSLNIERVMSNAFSYNIDIVFFGNKEYSISAQVNKSKMAAVITFRESLLEPTWKSTQSITHTLSINT